MMPCGTVLEAAKQEGYMTGLVVTSRITHVPPPDSPYPTSPTPPPPDSLYPTSPTPPPFPKLTIPPSPPQATPAAYISHIYDRDLESNIALQEIGYTHPFGRQVDILMGGGKCFFLPKSTPGGQSCRDDEINALALAKDKMGYSVFTDRAGFDKKQKMPYLGLFTKGNERALTY